MPTTQRAKNIHEKAPEEDGSYTFHTNTDKLRKLLDVGKHVFCRDTRRSYR